MSELRIFGYSDDNIEFRGHVHGEVGCYGEECDIVIGTGDTALGVFAVYGERGWVIGTYMPADVNEDNWSPPDCELRKATVDETCYSPTLVVQLPEDTPVYLRVGGMRREID